MVADSVAGEFAMSLRPDSAAPRRARAAIALALHKWDMKELLDDAALVASELVANAARLSETVELRLVVSGRTLRIEVVDHAAGEPVVKTQVGDDHSEDGRGLLLVDALAAAWGYDVRAGAGKVVWAVLTCP